MRSSIPQEERLEIKKKTHRSMMYLGIFSIVMLFLGFSSGYIVSSADNTWVSITLPEAFYASAITIVLSSITFFIALRLAKKGNFKVLPIMMIITLVLGFLFVKFQFDGWNTLMDKKMHFVDAVKVKGLLNQEDVEYGKDFKIFHKGDELKYVDGKFYDIRDEYNSNSIEPYLDADNTASSWLYAMTGLHLLHLLAGIISLIVVTIKSLAKRYNENDIVGIQVSSIYWHFLDFLWLYLLFLLYYIG